MTSNKLPDWVYIWVLIPLARATLAILRGIRAVLSIIRDVQRWLRREVVRPLWRAVTGNNTPVL